MFFSCMTFISVTPGHQYALIDSQRATCLCNHSYRRPIVKSNTLMAASVRGTHTLTISTNYLIYVMQHASAFFHSLCQ